MSNTTILIHCVWGTKRRFPFITPDNRVQIIDHIRDYSVRNGIHIDFINGHKDHIHCLLWLEANQSLALVMRNLKGESSRWIGANIKSGNRFGWASEYYAASVSLGILDRVRNYIRDQDVHHQKKSWDTEQQEFLEQIEQYQRSCSAALSD